MTRGDAVGTVSNINAAASLTIRPGAGIAPVILPDAETEWIIHNIYVEAEGELYVVDILEESGKTFTDTGAVITGETYAYSLAYLGNGIVVAGTGANAEIWRSTDYGVTWTDTGADITGETNIMSLAYLGNGIVVAGTSANAEIWRSTDYGVTWTDTGADITGETDAVSLAYLGNGIVVAGTGANAEIWRSNVGDGNELLFDSLAVKGSWNAYFFHLTNTHYLKVKNTNVASKLIGYDGIVSRD